MKPSQSVLALPNPPMSLDIEWSKLDEELAGHVQQFLNRHFKSIGKPAFIGDIEVIAFDWGTEAPRIEITDITDPFPEFYEPEEGEEGEGGDAGGDGERDAGAAGTRGVVVVDDHDHDQRAATAGAAPTSAQSVPAASPPPESTRSGFASPFSEPVGVNPARLSLNTPLSQQQRFNFVHSFHRSPFVAPQHPFNPNYSPPQQQFSYFPGQRSIISTTTEDWIDDEQQQQQPPPPPSVNDASCSVKSSGSHSHPDPTEMDFQVSMLISYKGDMSMTLLTELRMNYPSMMFMSLPIQLRVRSVEFEATAVVAYIKSMDRVCISMLEPELQDAHGARDSGLER